MAKLFVSDTAREIVLSCQQVLGAYGYAQGFAMVEEKRAAAERTFGDRAPELMALPFIEFLTRERLERASGEDLLWHRRRVLYPLHYEARSIRAMIRGRRRPSRFDLWETTVP